MEHACAVLEWRVGKGLPAGSRSASSGASSGSSSALSSAPSCARFENVTGTAKVGTLREMYVASDAERSDEARAGVERAG